MKKNILKNIFHALGVSEREAVPLKISWSLRCLYQIGFIISWTVLTALFVEQFGVEHLLWLFLVEAILMIIGTVFSSFFLSRFPLRAYLFTNIVLTLVALIIGFGYEITDMKFFIFLLLAKDVFAFQTSVALYRQDEHFFSPSEAVKMLPFVESAITVGVVLGAGLTVQFLNILDTQQVLWLWGWALVAMALIVTSLPVWLRAIPQFSMKGEKAKKIHKNPLVEGFQCLKKVKFLKYIMVVIVLQSAIVSVIEFEFTKDVQSHILPQEIHAEKMHSSYPLHASFLQEVKEKFVDIAEEAKSTVQAVSTNLIVHKTLAHDLGMFHLLFGLGALLVQLILTPKVIGRLGVIGTMLSYNVMIFFSLIGLLVGYGNINTLRAMQHGLHSLGDAPYHISFYSYVSSVRESIRLFLEGIIRPLGILVGVGILLWVPSGLTFYFILGCTVLLLLLSPLLRSSFTHLSQKNIELAADAVTEKMHAIEVLAQRGHHNPVLILAKELEKENISEIIEKKVIKTLTTIDSPEILHTYLEMLRSSKVSMKRKERILVSLLNMKSLEAYWQKHVFGQYHLIRVLKELFRGASSRYFRKLIVMNMFLHLPLHEVVPFFLETMKKADTDLKAVCLRSATMFDDPEIGHYLRPYLKARTPRLQGHAVMALWKFEDRTSLREVLDTLIQKKKKEPIISALYAIGEIQDDTYREVLASFMDDKDLEVRMHSLIALAKINDYRCVNPLLALIFGKDDKMSEKAYSMLRRVPEEMREHLKKLIRYEVSHRVAEVIHPEHIQTREALKSLPKAVLDRMKRWYTLGEKYDCLMVIESL